MALLLSRLKLADVPIVICTLYRECMTGKEAAGSWCCVAALALADPSFASFMYFVLHGCSAGLQLYRELSRMHDRRGGCRLLGGGGRWLRLLLCIYWLGTGSSCMESSLECMTGCRRLLVLGGSSAD